MRIRFLNISIEKLFAIILMASSFVGVAHAQSEDYPTNWFVGAGGGMNIGLDGQKFENRTNSHIGAGTAVDVYVGKYFNKTLGFRAGYHGLDVSNQYVDYGKERFHYAHADLLFRLGAVVPYVHAGFAYAKQGTPAAGIGLMLPICLGDRVSIVPDIKVAALNGGALSGEPKVRIGANVSATVGLKITLGKLKKQVADNNSIEESVNNIISVVAVTEPKLESMTEPVQEMKKKLDVIQDEQPAPMVETIVRPEQNVILFAFNSSELSDDALPILDSWAEFLLAHPELKVLVQGHTCNIGKDWANDKLSMKRAVSVSDCLISKGVDASRITTQGCGSSSPAFKNDSSWNRAHNRRAVISIN